MSDHLQKLREAIGICLSHDLLVAAHGPEWNKGGSDNHLLQIQPGVIMQSAIVFLDGKKVYAEEWPQAVEKFLAEWAERGVGDYHLNFGGSGCPAEVLKQYAEESDEIPRRVKTLIAEKGMPCKLPSGKVGVVADLRIWGLAENEILVMTEDGIQKHDVSTLDLCPELVYEYANG